VTYYPILILRLLPDFKVAHRVFSLPVWKQAWITSTNLDYHFASATWLKSDRRTVHVLLGQAAHIRHLYCKMQLLAKMFSLWVGCVQSQFKRIPQHFWVSKLHCPVFSSLDQHTWWLIFSSSGQQTLVILAKGHLIFGLQEFVQVFSFRSFWLWWQPQSTATCKVSTGAQRKTKAPMHSDKTSTIQEFFIINI
jgi:hypothetical protein